MLVQPTVSVSFSPKNFNIEIPLVRDSPFVFAFNGIEIDKSFKRFFVNFFGK